MSELSSNVNTFSIGYEETEESEKYNNDFYVARKTAKHFKTNHREYILSADDIKDNLEKTIYHMDEPVSNHVQTVNMLLAKFATEHVKVVLGGDGGDELFGGYERYYYSHFLDCLQKIPEIARKNSLSKFLFSSLGKNNLYEKLNCPQGADRYLSFFSQKEDKISSFLRKEYNRPKVSYDFFESQYFNKIDSKNFTQQFMLTDLSTWMSDESLLRSDKMSMAYGLEQRVPFLDHRLVEYAFRIPIKYKLGKKSFSKIGSSGKSYQGKVILKEAMSSYLPDFVLNQPKWGWFSPAAKWTRGGLNSFIKEVISPSYCEKTKDIFNFDAIDDIINKHVNKEEYALNTIWSIMTFQIWSRKFSKNIKL